MATSSIFKNFVIEGEEAVSNFIDLLFSEPIPRDPMPNVRIVEDDEELRRIFEGCEKNLARIKAEDEAKANDNR